MAQVPSEGNFVSKLHKDVRNPSLHMRGWLRSQEKRFTVRSRRFYYRLQWGLLTKHHNEHSPAIQRYYVYGSVISNVKPGLKVYIYLNQDYSAFSMEKDKVQFARTLILIGDDVETFQRWLTCLFLVKSRKLHDFYSLHHKLGCGADSVVSFGVNRSNLRERVAIKTISLIPREGAQYRSEKLYATQREILLQQRAANVTSRIAEVLDVFYDDKYCHIVMEHCSGGSLSGMLEKEIALFSEPFVRFVVMEVGRCLLALHQAGIVHRDVKCDNVLFRSADSKRPEIKLADFGFAASWQPNSHHTIFDFCCEKLGTQAYIAPEILRGDRYGAPADIFSLGVVCYVCLTGIFPSMGRDRLPGCVSETRGNLQSDIQRLAAHPGVPPDAVSFCRALLNEDPVKRPIAAALLQHKWIRGGRNVTGAPRKRPSQDVHSKVVWRRMFHAIAAIRELSMSTLTRNV